jgi:hypothetical protein
MAKVGSLRLVSGVLGVAAILVFSAGTALAQTATITPLTIGGTSGDYPLYGIDAQQADTTGPYHAPIAVRVTNTSSTPFAPTVTVNLTNVSVDPPGSLYPGTPCAAMNNINGTNNMQNTTDSYTTQTLNQNDTVDAYYDVQFLRDSGCAWKNNNQITFSYYVTVNNGATQVARYPASGSTPAILINGMSIQSNDAIAIVGCTGYQSYTGGVYNITTGTTFQCQWNWDTSSSFNGLRVWEDWDGRFFIVKGANSGYGTFGGNLGFNSPGVDCSDQYGNGSKCGSFGKTNLITQTVQITAIANSGGQGVACPDTGLNDCIPITATVYDFSGNGTHYQSTTTPIYVRNDGPTAVGLKEFDATRGGNDVTLDWHTGFEVDTLGFRIFRDDADGQRRLVTPDLIAGSALLTGMTLRQADGRSYKFVDLGAPQGSQYWLEDVALNGVRTLHGPVSPTTLASTSAAQMVRTDAQGGEVSPYLSALIKARPAARGVPGFGAPSPQISVQALGSAKSAQAHQFELAASPGAKILVRQEGWYRFTRQDLIAAGWDPGADARNLQLYAEGNQVAMLVTPLAGGNYAMEFYGTGLDTISTDTRVYWLALADSAGARIGAGGSGHGSSTPADFPYTVQRKDRSVYLPGIQNGDADNWFGSPVGPLPFPPADESIVVSNLDTASAGDATLQVALQGATTGLTHEVDVKVGGHDAGTLSFTDQTHSVATFSVPVSWLNNGAVPIMLSSEGTPAQDGSWDFSMVDYVSLTYPHLFQADSDALAFTVNGGNQVTVGGFTTSGIRVFDITNPNAATMLSATITGSGPYAATVTSSGSPWRTARFLALADTRVSAPAGLVANNPSTLNKNNNSADFIILSHPAFISAVAPLQALRQSQGLVTKVVDVTDVYDEFNFGEKDPAAIKAFVQDAKSSWKKAPKYILLVGDGSFDPRGYLASGNPPVAETPDFIPVKLVPTFFLKTASDNWFVDLNDDSLPKLAIGRLPVDSPAEAATVVSKIVGYDSGSTSQTVTLIADTNDQQNNFEAAIGSPGPPATGLAALVSGKSVQVLKVGSGAGASDIVGAFNLGTALVNWMGHGEDLTWSKSDVFNTGLVPSLTNSWQLPVVVAMDCLNGYFQDPTETTLAEALLKAPNGGAVAVWTSSGLTLLTSQVPANQMLLRSLFALQAPRIGDAMVAALNATSDHDVRRTWVLLGDPTARFK